MPSLLAPSRPAWRFAIDRGGTFTDVIASDPDGRIHTAKVLSESATGPGDAIADAIEQVLLEHGADTSAAAAIRVGTTVATNALLTRSGTPTVLVLSRGLGDLAWIRDQSRPDLFALEIHRPEPIASMVVEAIERVDSDGQVLEPLDEAQLRADLTRARAAGCRAAAICLMHGWRHGEHEQRAAAMARELGFEHVVTSRDAPLRGYVPRLGTLAADAALTPPLRRSLAPLRRRFDRARLLGMQSNGGLVGLDAFSGVNAVLSGPAGGLVGASAVAQAAGVRRIVTLDMGGTSTDVAWWDGAMHRCNMTSIAGEKLRVPMLDIHTIAAGGGSICTFDGQRLRVGPESAGAAPGPACYGLGGPATITDCNVVLGRVPHAFLPDVFGPGRDASIDPALARAALERLRSQMPADGAPGSIEALAEGFLTIAVEAMAGAVRRISIEQGRELREVALVAFGGAGGQLACRIAAALSIDTILLHPLAGLLSAWGIASADQRVVRRASLEQPLDQGSLAQAHVLADELAREALADVNDADAPVAHRRVVLRLPDREHGLLVDFGPIEQMTRAFAAACRHQYGYDVAGAAPVIAGVEVEAVAAGSPPVAPPAPSGEPMPPQGVLPLWLSGQHVSAAWFAREDLRAGQQIDGPALIREDGSTTVIDPAWRARVLADGTLRLDRQQASLTSSPSIWAAPHLGAPRAEQPDLTRLAVFGHRFRSIAEEMGAALQRTARSVNMRVRLDYSCAVFDAQGALVANGAHIPVHLGSMSQSVQHIIAARASDMRPGDAFLLNDPFHGGTHLPDLTLVSPSFDDEGTLRAFVASRGHHVDVGGLTPGSMPPDAKTLADEGVVVDNFLLVRDGQVRLDELRRLLASPPHPCRLPERVIDDLSAQLAANRRGLDALSLLAGEYAHDLVATTMRQLQDQAADCIAARLRTLSDGRAETPLDGGGVIAVAMRVDQDRGHVTFDFSGTSAQRPDNTNAPPAVTRAAVLYVLRCLIADDIPLNEGCMRHVTLIVAEGSLLNPRPGAAVAAGNVETSQLIVDTLMAAAGVMAASQGTMNNLTFGDAHVQSYETICGGTGAGPGFAGVHAVQSHMTNSRLTDPEVFEDNFPVVLRRFARRVGSGGVGLHAGGDGAVREIAFKRPLVISLVSSRRQHAPAGMAGGEPGAIGGQFLITADGRRIDLPGRFTRPVEAGDRLIIETPGGGGWGTPGPLNADA